jgi:hypothetical protein
MEILLLLLFFLVGLLSFVGYVVALVNAAKTEQWVWFVLMLLFGPLFIFYLIFAFERLDGFKRA